MALSPNRIFVDREGTRRKLLAAGFPEAQIAQAFSLYDVQRRAQAALGVEEATRRALLSRRRAVGKGKDPALEAQIAGHEQKALRPAQERLGEAEERLIRALAPFPALPRPFEPVTHGPARSSGSVAPIVRVAKPFRG